MANSQSGSGSQEHGSHKTSDHKDSSAGQKHASQQQVGSGKEHDPNNFANNPGRAAEAGRKGGQHSHDRD